MANNKACPVLVVEDDAEIREAISDFLRDEGFPVEVADNGKVALEKLKNAATLPCLILLDIMMPVMDGFAFRQAQLQDSKLANIPTAIVSADGNVKPKSERAKVSDYLTKPVDLDDLLALATRYC